jgi:hypothetical protein
MTRQISETWIVSSLKSIQDSSLDYRTEVRFSFFIFFSYSHFLQLLCTIHSCQRTSHSLTQIAGRLQPLTIFSWIAPLKFHIRILYSAFGWYQSHESHGDSSYPIDWFWTGDVYLFRASGFLVASSLEASIRTSQTQSVAASQSTPVSAQKAFYTPLLSL